MIRVTNTSIEFNGETPLEFKSNVSSFVRREILDLIEFGQHSAECIENGDYIELEIYEELKRSKENYESSCQQTRRNLENLLNSLDKAMEDGNTPPKKLLKILSEDLTYILGEIEQ